MLLSARQRNKPATSSWYNAQLAQVRTDPQASPVVLGRGSCDCTFAPNFSSLLFICCQQLHWEQPSFSRHFAAAQTHLLHWIPLESLYLEKELSMGSKQFLFTLLWCFPESRGVIASQAHKTHIFFNKRPDSHIWHQCISSNYTTLTKYTGKKWYSKPSVDYCWCRWDECIPL